jgi:YaiO family outer membrane protein
MPQWRLVYLFLGLATASAAAQVAPPPTAPATPSGPVSWVEAGGFYQHVSNGFGSWTGGYARLVLAGTRNAWYLDAKAQEAFRDRGVYGSLANVHSFGSRLYTQLGVGAGTGKYVLPDLRADGSVTLKLGAARALLFTAGGTYVKSKSIYDDQALFASLTWYATPSVLLEAGGRLNWSDPGAVRSARVRGALTAGRTGGTILTLLGSAGTEGYQLTSAPVTLQKFKSQDAGVSLRQWLGGHLGIVAAGEWYHNPFYTRAGGSLGLFHAW